MSRPGQSNGGFRPQEIQRRKFQEAAAITIDKQAVAIQKTREFVADLSVRLDKHDQELGAIRIGQMQDYQHFEAICAPLCHSSFWSRLRWLLTGR